MRRAFLFVLVLTCGCGQASDQCGVSGKVTFQGAPLDEGTIQFFTTDENPGPAGGALIKEGSYTVPVAHGLKPGKYRVFISAQESMPELKTPEMSVPPTRERIPPAYNTASTILIEVQPGQINVHDFTID